MTLNLAGRADLLRALAADDPQLVAAMADLLGYQEEPEAEPAPLGFVPEFDLPIDIGIRTETPYIPSRIPFWWLETFTAVAPVVLPPLPQVIEDSPWRGRPTTTPRAPQLAPERAVLTRLRQASAIRQEGREIDVEAVVERLERGRLLDWLPYRQRRVWGASICIVVDRSRRLVPYWRDQDALAPLLAQLFPSNGRVVALCENGDLPSVLLEPGSLVLVLGDLGCLARQSDALRQVWVKWGRELREQGMTTVALVPAIMADIPVELTRVWTILPWGGAVGAAASSADTVQRLLTLLSPTVRLEPGLLRAVRCLLPEGRHDPGLEARVWQDPALASQHSVAASWHPEQQKMYKARFAEQPEALRKAVLELVKTWRAELEPAVWFSEIVDLDPQSKQVAIAPADLEDAARFLTHLADELEKLGDIPVASGAWIEGVTERLTEDIGHDPRVRRAVHRLYELIRPRDDQTEVPVWSDPAVASSPALPVRQVELWQAADQLVAQAAGQPAVERGSRVGLVYTANGEVLVSPGAATEAKTQVMMNLNCQPRLTISLPKDREFRVGTDRDRVQFARDDVPTWAWASESGRDTFGLWAAFEFAGVRQYLRWIPPGRFWMGSPEDEEGRWNDEGPRHEVQITQGFWLFDTPCTQALWRAVMGDNPSHFQKSDWRARPVEQVSWEDSQRFIARLNAQLPELALALPTEAEWEYACRAGTTTARYADDLEAIAWHRENSDRETKPVRGRQPNGWGLYDMLGNVDEWCHDGRRDYAQPVGPDPLGPTTAGAGRVIRGGGWDWSAQSVRSACRGANHPGRRYDALGFRCASGGLAGRK